jgi:hypothetical protein
MDRVVEVEVSRNNCSCPPHPQLWIWEVTLALVEVVYDESPSL